jgi:ribosomal protein S18 acetylase RimI-like enzyme
MDQTHASAPRRILIDGLSMPNPKSIQVRAGVESDASALAAFAARTFEETFAADNRPEDLQAHLSSAFGLLQQTQELLDPNMVSLLAHQGANLVAFAQVQRKDPPPCVLVDRAIELHRFYVDRPAQGSGIAQLLMDAVHDAARAFDGKHLWLSVWERNPRAIAFYKKVGFTDCGSTVFYVGPDAQVDRVMIAPVKPIPI